MDQQFRILIIDDDIHLAATLKNILDGEGYGTDVAYDGQTALDMCKGMVFDLALVDIKLTDIQGVQLVDKLVEIIPDIEAVIITGYASLDTAVEAVSQRPILAYLTKPLDMDQFLAFIRQVVERRRAEKAQRESENRLKVIIEAAKDIALMMTDLQGINARILEFSPGAEHIFGYSHEEVIGRPVGMLHLPEDVAVFPQKVESMWRCEEGRSTESVLVRKNGEKFPALLTTYPVNDAQGKVVAAVGVSVDITERKRVEDGIRYYSETLEQMVENRTTELRLSKEKLELEIEERKKIEDKLRETYENEKALREQLEKEIDKRVEFTRALAHELKTPLTSILMSSQTLGVELNEEPLKSLAKNISRGASNLNDRIDELLDVAKGEIGMLQLKAQSLDMRQLFDEAIDDLATLAQNRGLSLVQELPPSLPRVWADEVRSRQIILNLLNNALKFTPTGGMIYLRARERDDKLLIEVQDTGPGIPEEEQGRIFDPYQRMHTDREGHSGLGLGLALCRSLVILHGGDIWVESEPGKGATFTFSLPLETTQSLNNQ